MFQMVQLGNMLGVLPQYFQFLFLMQVKMWVQESFSATPLNLKVPLLNLGPLFNMNFYQLAVLKLSKSLGLSVKWDGGQDLFLKVWKFYYLNTTFIFFGFCPSFLD